MSLGSRIRGLRKKKRLYQKDIAEKLGMGSSNFGHIENDRVVPSSTDLKIIAEILETTTEYLLGSTDDPSPSDEKKTTLAFKDGGKGWTEEEFRIAEAAIAAYRKLKNEGSNGGGQ